ncbi:MAG TPA: divalent metal cation transporter [Candidatus Limnocylindrales bacterium]
MRKWLGLALGVVTATGGFLDAGTVVTAGEAGAQFGLGLLWAALVATLAVMLLVEMTGRFAAVSGKPYAAAVREHFGFKFYLLPLASELIAESVMLAAEIGGIAVAVSIATGLPWLPLFPLAALFVWLLVYRAPFSLIENGPAVLGLVTLSFLVGIAVLGGPNEHLVRSAWPPAVGPGKLPAYLGLAAAILGATISPYLIYFYSSGAREEGWNEADLTLNKVTAVVGMGFGSLGSIALIVLAAMVLLPQGKDGSTLPQLASTMTRALGAPGTLLFALALFATCTGAAFEVSLGLAYDVAQGFGWQWGEDEAPVEAARFNLVLTAVVVVSVVIGLLIQDPASLAIVGSTLIALFLPISLAPFLVIMNDRDELGERTNGRLSNIATGGVVGLAFVVAVLSLVLTFVGG